MTYFKRSKEPCLKLLEIYVKPEIEIKDEPFDSQEETVLAPNTLPGKDQVKKENIEDVCPLKNGDESQKVVSANLCQKSGTKYDDFGSIQKSEVLEVFVTKFPYEQQYGQSKAFGNHGAAGRRASSDGKATGSFPSGLVDYEKFPLKMDFSGSSKRKNIRKMDADITIQKPTGDVLEKFFEDRHEDIHEENAEEDYLENKFVEIKKGVTQGRKRILGISSSSSTNSSRVGKIKRTNKGVDDKLDDEKGGDGSEAACSQQGSQLKTIFKCPHCKYQTNRNRKLAKHLYTHSNTKLFKCSECDYICNYKGSLGLHLLTHSTAKLLKCSECDYRCNRRDSLKRHSLTHSDTKLFKCSECDYACNEKGSLNRHSLTHSDIKLFKCDECDYQCNQKGSLKLHSFSHSDRKLFKCSECEFECNDKRSLRRHSSVHSDTKLFKCSECDYKCNHKGNLKIHFLTHSNAKLFKCSECDFECNHKGSLKRHLLTHSETKMFKCCECDFECKDKGSLKRHSFTHSNMKLFKCSECDYECNQKSSLKRHSFKHEIVQML